MRYYYFNPKSKEYYFPKGFENYSLFATFYRPYKLTAKFLWWIWKSVPLFRYLFSTDQPEKFLPIQQINGFVTSTSVMAFNLGTSGIERKITVLGVDAITNEEFFIKYATTEITCLNVMNEGVILNQLSHLLFVPILKQKIDKENDYSLIITSVLKGEKMIYQPINEKLLNILFVLSEQNVTTNRVFLSDKINCFAHGDFCVWNILVDSGEYKLFDWELAGIYPLGFDLFTYIFQYEFLVKETEHIMALLDKNSLIINKYFNHFNVEHWMVYLYEFAKLKHRIESDKNDLKLVEYYFRLREFAFASKMN